VGPLSAERPVDPVHAAKELAHELLRDVGTRWVHTCAVVDRAGVAARSLPTPAAATTLLVAAWLHDVGYAPRLRDTGFHPLDGARRLTTDGWPPEVARLVAHHSAARYVADVRGLRNPMFAYDDPSGYSGPVADALTWADQTTGPSGQLLDVRVRLDEMLRRHGPIRRTPAATTSARRPSCPPWHGPRPPSAGPRACASRALILCHTAAAEASPLPSRRGECGRCTRSGEHPGWSAPTRTTRRFVGSVFTCGPANQHAGGARGTE
jgi:hypothetical protein